MVRQWQELNHGSRYSESYSASLPDFMQLASSFGMKGLRADTADDLDGIIDEMIATDGPVLAISALRRRKLFPHDPFRGGA